VVAEVKLRPRFWGKECCHGSTHRLRPRDALLFSITVKGLDLVLRKIDNRPHIAISFNDIVSPSSDDTVKDRDPGVDAGLLLALPTMGHRRHKTLCGDFLGGVI
jgi:hypothetical protein